jgi:hypothetical protein
MGLEPPIIQPVAKRYTTELSRIQNKIKTWFFLETDCGEKDGTEAINKRSNERILYELINSMAQNISR